MLEIDSLPLDTKEGPCTAYAVVERESAFCWGASATRTVDFAGATAVVTEAIEKLRKTKPAPQQIELRHDGSRVYRHEWFVQTMRRLGVATSGGSAEAAPVASAERALWDMRVHMSGRSDEE